MKRRIIPLILALALVFVLAAPACAADDPLSIAGDGTDVDVPETVGEDTAPAVPEMPRVRVSTQSLTVDGAAVDVQAYSIGGSNFFKLRDVAMMLSGTDAQFSVDYDADTRTAIAESGKPYTAIGGELTAGQDMSAACVVSDHSIMVNGEKLDTIVYNIGGSNYFMLRVLGSALGFGVDYDAETQTVVVTTK